METVIDFQKVSEKLKEEKEKNSPHLSGEARCIQCHHKWYTIIPAVEPVPELECPKCGLNRGFFCFVFQPEEDRWVCNCGGDLFFIVADGTKQCARCNLSTENGGAK